MVENLVDAIEDGRIVRVAKEYAIREGLMILRKTQDRSFLPAPNQRPKKPDPAMFEPFRRPLRKNNVSASLKDNFHWAIMARRKDRQLTRKQLAEALGENELHIKMLENGVLPSDDFILIAKVERYLGLNLRKDLSDNQTPAQKMRYDDRLRQKMMEKEKNISFVAADKPLTGG